MKLELKLELWLTLGLGLELGPLVRLEKELRLKLWPGQGPGQNLLPDLAGAEVGWLAWIGIGAGEGAGD